MQEKSCIARALTVAVMLSATTLWSTAPLAQGSTNAAARATDSGTRNQIITFRQPRVTGKGWIALRKLANSIAPSKKNSYQLERVDIDVYINPLSDAFTRTAAANMGNEVARYLVRWGVPGDKISYATKPEERPQTARRTYDVELRVVGNR
jgi:hypothetical protein